MEKHIIIYPMNFLKSLIIIVKILLCFNNCINHYKDSSCLVLISLIFFSQITSIILFSGSGHLAVTHHMKNKVPTTMQNQVFFYTKIFNNIVKNNMKKIIYRTMHGSAMPFIRIALGTRTIPNFYD